jgi:hypothetical protein
MYYINYKNDNYTPAIGYGIANEQLKTGTNVKIIKMNRNIFENNLRIIKESNAKQRKEINHEEQQKFYNWLIDNNLHKYLK